MIERAFNTDVRDRSVRLERELLVNLLVTGQRQASAADMCCLLLYRLSEFQEALLPTTPVSLPSLDFRHSLRAIQQRETSVSQ